MKESTRIVLATFVYGLIAVVTGVITAALLEVVDWAAYVTMVGFVAAVVAAWQQVLELNRLAIKGAK